MTNTKRDLLNRRMVLQQAGAFGLLLASGGMAPTCGRFNAPVVKADDGAIDITISDFPLQVNGRVGKAIAANGTVPGPIIRLREGQTAVIRVTNRLREISSIHWHGLILPPDMDGVPGVSFGGIKPGETFTYRFPVRQSGTYWCHSHSGAQELLGLYMPLVIDPIEPEPFRYDREFVVLLSDWSFESPMTIISKLKKEAGYFNYQKRTAGEFFRDAKSDGFAATVKERLTWSKMRMDPTDFADVTGYTYTYLLNGLLPEANWTGIFRTGEMVRLRCICAAAMTYFDSVIPRDGFELHYQVTGEGVPVVLLSGGPGFETEYRVGAEKSLPSGYKSVILEQRGIGSSRPTAITAETVALELVIGDLDALRVALKQERLTILGHSWGGMLAMAYAAKYPDRVDRLILVAPGGMNMDSGKYIRASVHSRLRPEDLEYLSYWENQSVNAVGNDKISMEALRAILPGYFYDHEEGLAFAATMHNFYADTAEVLRADLLKHYDVRTALGHLKRPVLLVQGYQDPIGQLTAADIHQTIRSSTLRWINECGHYPWIEQPELFASIVTEFLTESSTPTH